ncbi:MAG: ATP synthase F1 subunit epsilon [Pirellulaceae bacterium]|nr:ATP synthase F1 subunit epsilon [Pirellulaceae bacterium]
MIPRLTCILVTPEHTVVEAEADFVALPLDDGELGVAPRRAPLIGRLGFGQVRVRVGRKETRYYVDAGFVQIADNVVYVLTNRALPVEAVNRAAAEQQLEAARKLPLVTPQQESARDRALRQARAQLHAARRA